MARFTRLLPALALGSLLLLSACSGSDTAPASTTETADATPQQRSVRVEALRVLPTTFSDVITLTGTVEALNDARIASEGAGTVLDVLPLGTQVAAGGTVARIDATLATAAREQAEASIASYKAQLALARDTYRRQEVLFQDSIISALEFETVHTQAQQAEAQVAQARAALAQATKQLANTQLTTPFAGVVESHFVEEGEQVMPSTPVVRVVNTRAVRVRAGVPERYANDIREGTNVTVRFRAYGTEPRTGTVSFAGNAIDPQSRTFPIEISISNTGRVLKPEMIADVQVTRSTRDNVLVVPQSAVVRDENGVTLFVASGSDDAPVAERRSVTLGPSYDGRTIVESGLSEGDLVLVLGQNNVTDGDALVITETHTAVGPSGTPYQTETDTPAAP